VSASHLLIPYGANQHQPQHRCVLPGVQLQLLQPVLLLLPRREPQHPLVRQQQLTLLRLALQLHLQQLLLHLVRPAAWLLLQLPLSLVGA
jgi:hypothetical protein